MENDKGETINIDGVAYSFADLSENAKKQIANIQFVDNKLQELGSELAISDTARMAYTQALKNEISSTE